MLGNYCSVDDLVCGEKVMESCWKNSLASTSMAFDELFGKSALEKQIIDKVSQTLCLFVRTKLI